MKQRLFMDFIFFKAFLRGSIKETEEAEENRK